MPSAGSVALRPITTEDSEFLYAVYASTRQEELRPLDWTAEEKDAFLRFQFEAQRTHYSEQFPLAHCSVILVGAVPAGRLYVDRRETEIRVIDIALLPGWRGRGIGRGLMRQVLDEAAARQVPVRIHVERGNAAMRLYERLGFRPVESQGVYVLMESNASKAAN